MTTQTTDKGILDGIVVLDLTRNVAGPLCTMTMGDLGADVIKIERPGAGDDTREWRPPSWGDESATFLTFNRNKRSLALDIDRPEGRDVVRRLAARTDVMVESFRSGSLAKRGMGYEDLSRVNPGLIYCSISAFGSRGPHAGRPAYDPVIQAYSGMMSTTGEAGRPPVRTGPATIDIGTGMWAALGIVLSLYERQKTGVGRLVEASLLETGIGWMSYHLAGFLGSGKVPGRLGSRGVIAAPYEAFATKDDDLYIAAPNDQLFERLCHVLALPDLPLDPRFRTNPDRIAHREELHEFIEVRLRTGSAADWEALLLKRELPCSRIRGVDQLDSDPQVEALELLLRVPHPTIPDLRLVDLPLSIDGKRACRRETPPALGEHTDEILTALGFEPAEIDGLRRRGVVA
jgi:crotonobetainyl-CoA:carnitine CoA-transferase CaiB-like acyl-CoA transferase